MIFVKTKLNILSMSIQNTKKPSFDTLTSFLRFIIFAFGLVFPKIKCP